MGALGRALGWVFPAQEANREGRDTQNQERASTDNRGNQYSLCAAREAFLFDLGYLGVLQGSFLARFLLRDGEGVSFETQNATAQLRPVCELDSDLGCIGAQFAETCFDGIHISSSQREHTKRKRDEQGKRFPR